MESKTYRELAQEVSTETAKIPARIWQNILKGGSFNDFPKIQELLDKEYYSKEEVDHEKLKERN